MPALTKVDHVFLIFLDGIGLGANDPAMNPFAVVEAPTLHQLSGGERWLKSTGRTETDRAIFLPTDACLGVPGRPQSATGQATIMTGLNVPQRIGEHYGPRPNAPIRAILDEDNIYKQLTARGLTTAMFDAKPPMFFYDVNRGKRLLSSLQQAAAKGGAPLRTREDYYAGKALSEDFTGQGWRDFLGEPEAPVYTPYEAGQLAASLAQQYAFSMFTTFLTDEIGHRGPLEDGVRILERFDGFMRGLLDAWDASTGLIIITSDHGNMEDVSIRQHTENDVPTVAIGAGRAQFADGFSALTDITPKILDLLPTS